MAHNIFFNPSEVTSACKVAKADGSEGLAKVFLNENLVHTVSSSHRYQGLWCMANGRKGHMVVCFIREKHVGQISPLKVNDHHPTINIQKYKVWVETDNRGCQKGALLTDAQTLEYYEIISYIDEFDAKMHARLADRNIILCNNHNKTSLLLSSSVEISNTKIISVMYTCVFPHAKINSDELLANIICQMAMKFDKGMGLPKAKFYDFTNSYMDVEGK